MILFLWFRVALTCKILKYKVGFWEVTLENFNIFYRSKIPNTLVQSQSKSSWINLVIDDFSYQIIPFSFENVVFSEWSCHLDFPRRWHGKLHAYAISFFFPWANSMISHATHQIIRRIQSPDKEISFSSTVNTTLHVSIYYYIRCILTIWICIF